jgi:uncharacterized membrane-anchored protein YhcB (DUF1043 family)
VFSLSALIITALAATAFGGLLGALLIKAMHPQEQQSRSMGKRLHDAEDKLLSYQQEVTEHFAETSQLVNTLTQSYKEVYSHLADSALQLSNPDMSRQLIDAGDGKLPLTQKSDSDKTEKPSEPPKDWAPKAPGETGQLSEEFGLGNNEELSELDTSTAQ